MARAITSLLSNPPAHVTIRAKNDRRKLRSSKRRIMTKNRFDGRHCPDITPDVVQFGEAMHVYLKRKGELAWTPGEVLDVLCDLGYKHAERDFRVCVHKFANSIARLKRGTPRRARRPFPTWSEVLAEAILLGWYRGQRPSVV
jgi:hypothetical protein